MKGILAAALIAALAGGAWWFVSGRNGTTGTSGTTGTNGTNVVHVPSVPSVPSVSSAPSVTPAGATPATVAKPATPARPAHVLIEAGHKGIQLWEGGPYWATTNIGAEKPEDYGYYFWWGDTVGYKREGDSWVASDGSQSSCSFAESSAPTYGKSFEDLRNEGWITKDDVLTPEHDAAQKKWGGGWRMPTNQELDDLSNKNKCDWKWTTRNGVNGYEVCGRGAYASARIFLPCAGYGDGTSLNRAGSYGYYWSSVPYSGYNYDAWYLYFCSSDHYTSNFSYRKYGQSIRPVQSFTK